MARLFVGGLIGAFRRVIYSSTRPVYGYLPVFFFTTRNDDISGKTRASLSGWGWRDWNDVILIENGSSLLDMRSSISSLKIQAEPHCLHTGASIVYFILFFFPRESIFRDGKTDWVLGILRGGQSPAEWLRKRSGSRIRTTHDTQIWDGMATGKDWVYRQWVLSGTRKYLMVKLHPSCGARFGSWETDVSGGFTGIS
jgi:hypothetical protein